MIYSIFSVEHMFSEAEKERKEPPLLAEFHYPSFPFPSNPGRDDRLGNDSLLALEQIFKRSENVKDCIKTTFIPKLLHLKILPLYYSAY